MLTTLKIIYLRKVISNSIDILPGPLPKLLRNRAFRYLITAGIATVVDVVLFFMISNYILHGQDFIVPVFGKNILVRCHTASILPSFSFGLLTNFTLTKVFVFQTSDLRTRVQFFRFIVVAMVTFLANYGFMNILVSGLEFNATISRLVSAITVGVMSFVIHKAFSFKA